MHTQCRVCNMHDNATGPMNKMMCPCAMSLLLALVSAKPSHTQANSVVEEREDIPAGRRLAAARLKTLCWRCRWLKQLQDKVLRRGRAELFMIRHSLASRFSLGDSRVAKLTRAICSAVRRRWRWTPHQITMVTIVKWGLRWLFYIYKRVIWTPF